jgi:hypothetical protein
MMDCKVCGYKHGKTLCYEALEKEIAELKKHCRSYPQPAIDGLVLAIIERYYPKGGCPKIIEELAYAEFEAGILYEATEDDKQENENTRLRSTLEKIANNKYEYGETCMKVAKEALENRGLPDGIGGAEKPILPASAVQHRSVSPDRHAPKRK